MKALIQRVSRASVRVDAQVVGQIGHGYLILLGISVDDTEKEVVWLAKKCAKIRIFRDENGVMNKALPESGGEAMVVSQFTLYANTAKGNRPSYIEAARPEIAEPLYESFVRHLGSEIGQKVETGVFGAMMDVELVNDGPVTLILEKNPDG